jgi:hypothetical protein
MAIQLYSKLSICFKKREFINFSKFILHENEITFFIIYLIINQYVNYKNLINHNDL